VITLTLVAAINRRLRTGMHRNAPENLLQRTASTACNPSLRGGDLRESASQMPKAEISFALPLGRFLTMNIPIV
jgi:hypothetical protein